MSALKLAASVLNRDKPHSSITNLVDILTSPQYSSEAYDSIPELVDSISLQSTGPSETSRALRKKIKHGDNHQKYRALVILNALMENGDNKFRTACMDDQLIDALKHLSSDPLADNNVKKKLLSILASWSNQFKNDPSMSFAVAVYKQSRPIDRRSHGRTDSAEADFPRSLSNDKEAAKKRAKQEEGEAKERARKAEREAKQQKNRPRRAPFNFETEKPQILTSIANASQASSNLANAIILVNSEKESITDNPRVQECLENAKAARKTIVRYIQLVENEEMIGTLIETNERIISALQMYDNLLAPNHSEDPTSGIQASMGAMSLSSGELAELQEQQLATVACARQRQSPTVDDGGDDHDEVRGSSSRYVHPDLQDLSFNGLENERDSLPPPLQPSSAQHGTSSEAVWDQTRGSLSDFSDYDSEDDRPLGNAHPIASSAGIQPRRKLVDVEDPFADPFED